MEPAWVGMIKGVGGSERKRYADVNASIMLSCILNEREKRKEENVGTEGTRDT